MRNGKRSICLQVLTVFAVQTVVALCVSALSSGWMFRTSKGKYSLHLQSKRMVSCVLLHVHCFMCTASCALLHVYCFMCTASCVLIYVYCFMCTASCVLIHVHCFMCTASCVLLHVYCFMCTASCALIHVYCFMCTASCVLLYVYCFMCTDSTSAGTNLVTLKAMAVHLHGKFQHLITKERKNP